MNKEKRLATIKETVELYPEVSYHSLRMHVDRRDSNGLDSCVSKSGIKIIIDLDKYEVWLKEMKRAKVERRDKAKARRVERWLDRPGQVKTETRRMKTVKEYINEEDRKKSVDLNDYFDD